MSNNNNKNSKKNNNYTMKNYKEAIRAIDECVDEIKVELSNFQIALKKIEKCLEEMKNNPDKELYDLDDAPCVNLHNNSLLFRATNILYNINGISSYMDDIEHFITDKDIEEMRKKNKKEEKYSEDQATF